MANTIYDFKLIDINGNETSLAQYKDKILLIVNVASKCGFTKQYVGLEKIYTEYKNKGLVVLGFPCNQFSSQEPGSEGQIRDFCSLTYHVDFPMFSKINVNGEDAHPLYKFLKDKSRGILGTKAIKWNFTKFLVSRDGRVIKRFGSITEPT